MTRLVSEARRSLRARLACAGAMMLALGACEQRDQGQVAASQPAPLASLDAAAALPYAPPAPVGRYAPAEGYRYAERAYAVQQAVYDTPPDYGFRYQDDEPLVWETADDYAVYAEPYDGGYRSYYYEPGADYPYFIRDAGYGYGYDRGGVLIAVIDSAGRYLPAADFRRVAPSAGRYFAHARELRMASRNAERIRLDEQDWRREQPRVVAAAAPLLNAARQDRDWRQWRQENHNREVDRFAAEQTRRASLARAQVADTERRDNGFLSRFMPAPNQREQRGEADRRDREVAMAGRQADRAQAEQQQRLANAAADHAGEAADRAQDRARMQDLQARRAADADQMRRAQASAQADRLREQAQQRQVRYEARVQAQAQAQQQDRAREQARVQAQAQAEKQRQQQAQAREQARTQAQAQAQRERQQQAQAREQARSHAQDQAQQERQQQVQAREQARAQSEQQTQAREQARAAEQQARQAAAHERAQVQGQAQAQAHPQAQGQPARGDGKGKGRDRKKDDDQSPN